MGCKENSCGGKITNARCTRYEGELSDNTTIEECSKPSVHDVLEDVSIQLDELANQLDLTSLENECLEVEGDEILVKDYLQAIIDRICSFTADCDAVFNTPIECAGFDYKCFVDACGDEFVPNNLKELLQMLINRSCEESPELGSRMYHTKVEFYPDYAEETGYPLISGAVSLIGTTTSAKIDDLDMTNLTSGEYLLDFEAVIEGGGTSENGINFNYEIRLDNSSIPFSTRIFRIKAGTPADEYSHIGVKVPVTITDSSEVLTVWINNFGANVSLAVIGGSLTATRI